MHLLKTLDKQIVLFDNKNITLFNNKYITNKQRFFVAIIGIIVAILGIIFHLRDETVFFLIAYFVLLTVWGGYFIAFLFRNKDPEQINYSEISKIVIEKQKNRINVFIYYNNSKTLQLKTLEVNQDLIELLKNKNLIHSR